MYERGNCVSTLSQLLFSQQALLYLFRVKSKKRPKKFGGLENISYSGCLRRKSIFGVEQKACVIQV